MLRSRLHISLHELRVEGPHGRAVDLRRLTNESQNLGFLWAGTLGYYLLYNLLFFLVHRATWSLSAFNSESNSAAVLRFFTGWSAG